MGGVAAFQEVKGLVAMETCCAWASWKTATASGVVLVLRAPCRGQRADHGEWLAVDLPPSAHPFYQRPLLLRATSSLAKGFHVPFSLYYLIKEARMINRTLHVSGISRKKTLTKQRNFFRSFFPLSFCLECGHKVWSTGGHIVP